MKERYAKAHMKAAFIYADLSYAKRRKCGCVIVKNDRIISIGFNGTPPGWDNCCEDEHGQTVPEVLHAEANAIAKLARSDESGEGADVFVTLEPCLSCAKFLSQIKIRALYFHDYYVSSHEPNGGLEFLRKCGINVHQLELSE